MTKYRLPQRPDTPCVLINLEIARRNIARVQDYLDSHSIKCRPHIKTHKLIQLARAQIEAGAIGITCQKLGEAEVMAEAGIKNILITYNILGAAKLNRLRDLADKCQLQVTADSKTTIRGLSQKFAQAQRPLDILIECDTGQNRCGVQTPAAALDLARLVDDLPGIDFAGLMTYPPKNRPAQVNRFLLEAMKLCTESGLKVACISNGGTPGITSAHLVDAATEHRPGTYIYNDKSLVSSGDCDWSDCALTVRSTIVSRPTENRAIIDAGAKTLTPDSMGLEDFGHVTEFPEARITELHEEHGILDLSNLPGKKPDIGAEIHIIPNHACVVSNMFDQVFLHYPDGKITPAAVDARGLVW